MASCSPCCDFSSEMFLFCSEEAVVRWTLHFLQLACMPLDSQTLDCGLIFTNMDLILAWSFLWMLALFCFFFFCHLKHFSSISNPLPYEFVGKVGSAIICYHLCIFWKVWHPQAQWSFLFIWNLSRIDICMLYEVASYGSPWDARKEYFFAAVGWG